MRRLLHMLSQDTVGRNRVEYTYFTKGNKVEQCVLLKLMRHILVMKSSHLGASTYL